MDWETYREWTRTTAQYPKDKEEEYLLIGLANEVGEVLGNTKNKFVEMEINIKRYEPNQVMFVGIQQEYLTCMT